MLGSSTFKATALPLTVNLMVVAMIPVTSSVSSPFDHSWSRPPCYRHARGMAGDRSKLVLRRRFLTSKIDRLIPLPRCNFGQLCDSGSRFFDGQRFQLFGF